MTLERKIAQLFRMDEVTWLRHANPWSVILRNTVLPLLILAFWSRIWLGWWAIIPVTLALLWNWFNPRLFPPPESLDHWTSKGVLGERVWLNRDKVPVPKNHSIAPNILTTISALGMVFVIWGVVVLKIWPTLFGAMVVYLSKLWFLDRMVWLWEDMKDATPEYRTWRNRLK
ncbi:hypothetical protein ANME2D_03129 [Candidatus Methanoperedens nitroreducens]|uniref:Uncharacterized protein n=1 Tax=Candidatus Methanoperedens nitratireducens TaxID=1392998 RepID=A0A062V136_9EURY|nr:DUF6653 family protein [Candidatus Methanoperedens nitroreducens]KCZ71097.1 hypothetical protein ANME2D_03129 [Candidatus Methanoperedens nitroreducens]MDJ1421527.1 hypothetical protein [Candidatus Methanoperedens sp.]